MWQFKCKITFLIGLLFGFINLSVSLYEDQIGKFDWKRDFVGKLKYSQFDSSSANVKKLFVATNENVVAALGLKSGDIIWRQVLEKSSQGEILFLGVDTRVVTVSGINPSIVRSWDQTTGVLASEWTLPVGPPNTQVNWFLTKGQLFQVIAVDPSHLEITSYNINVGNKISSKQIPVSWMSGISGCKLVAPYLACLVRKEESVLYSINLSGQDAEIQSKPVSLLFPSAIGQSPLSLEVVLGALPVVSIVSGDKKQMVQIGITGPIAISKPLPTKTELHLAQLDKTIILLKKTTENQVVSVSASDAETGESLSNVPGEVNFPPHYGQEAMTSVVCALRKDRGVGCRIVFSTEDHSIAMFHLPGKIVWTRDEGLASVVAVEMLDLPLSDSDSAIEKEFDHQDWDIGILPSGFVGVFIHRVTSQLLQVYTLFSTVIGLGSPLSPTETSGLVRDEFSLHKMIVIASDAGKLYGMNNQNGDIMWQRRLEGLEAFTEGVSERRKMVLFVQRSTRHYPFGAQCTLLARDKKTGDGVLVVFNPFNGEGIGDNNGVIKLGYRVKQTLLLHQTDKEFLRGIILLDYKDSVHVFPPSSLEAATSVAGSTFIFTADPATGILVGHSLGFSTNRKLVATQVWEVKLTQGSQKITHVVSKNPLEKVHSQGRVLGDRSVLYKYNNPNLVAVVTQGNDPVHKYFLNIYLVDVVSGAVVFSVCHKKAREPVHIVHSENWLVYTYFSEKSRRTELASLELYEGKTQSNTTAFSSVNAPRQPIVDRQAYILPSMVDAMRETITEKGITSKHILVALAGGGILELPWMFVDPRRPITVTAEMREEGVIPYMPELPLPSDAIINYNQTLQRVLGIHTAPSGLESTSLVLVYGLDMFCTRVAPSKQFDVLKEDFDYFLIAVVLLALVVASYVTKKLASKKALKQAWK